MSKRLTCGVSLRSSFSKYLGLFKPENMSAKKNFRSKAKFANVAVKKAKFSLPEVNENRVASVLPTPIKSYSDKKEYKAIKLTNGLTALLISDLASLKNGKSDDTAVSSSSESDYSSDEASEESESDGMEQSADEEDTRTSRKDISDNEEKMAACALSVNVGSYSDPKDIQGLAHFLEHMVFMGSTKYPKENDFDSFIKKKGGSDNAGTDVESTAFVFDIQEKHLAEAMDKFSHFFVSPLMREESMQREREAVESEFAMSLPSDSSRMDQLLASTFAASHPATTFSWGNMKSLKDMVPSDKYLHEQLHKFRKRHYSAHRMTLVVQARLSLDVLEKFVVCTFGLIPSNDLPPDDFSKFNYTPKIITPEFHGLFYVKPVKAMSKITLTWCMRSFLKDYESKPHDYVAFILGHEGRYSLISYLREKVWALAIESGSSDSGIDHTSMYYLFELSLVLTQEGMNNLDEVLVTVFSFINMVREVGPSKRLYEDIKKVADMDFRFEEETAPYDNVETIVEDMHIYPSEHYLCGSELYYKYEPEAIRYVLDSMRHDNVNIIVFSKNHPLPIEYDQKEQWFETEYKRIDIPEDLKERFRTARPLDCFKLPEDNIYITEKFDLIPSHVDKVIDKSKCTILDDSNKDVAISGLCGNNDYPILVKKDDLMELWYRADYKFRFPTAFVYIYFISPVIMRSARDAVILDIWSQLLKHHLVEIVYPAEMAGLVHQIYVTDKGLVVKVNGYNEKLHLLVDSITKEIRDFHDSMSPEMFSGIKEMMAKAYHNGIIKPSKLNRDVRLFLLMDHYWSALDKMEELKTVEVEDVLRVGQEFLGTMYVQMLVQGNILSSEALDISAKVYDNIKWKSMGDPSTANQVMKIKTGEAKCRLQSFNKEDKNTLITNYYQSDISTVRDYCIVELLIMLMEEPLFDTLRTKEQLGYNVFCMTRYTLGVLGYSITVNTQADKFSAQHVDTRIESFLKLFSKQIKKLSDKSFQQSKQAFIKLKQNMDIDLKEEVTRNWTAITSMEYDFDRLPKEIECIQTLKHADLKKWLDKHTMCGSADNLRKLTIQIVGHAVPEECHKETEENDESLQRNYTLEYLANDSSKAGDTSDCYIKDLNEYRKSLDVYPCIEKKLQMCACSRS